MKKLTTLTFFTVLVLTCAASAWANRLTVACDRNFPPFEFKDPTTGKHTGFDVELWSAIAEEIGVAYDLQIIDFNGIIPGLQSGKLDVGIAGITIKPDRAKVIDFSDGYYNAGLLLLVQKSNRNINGIEDLKGKVVSTKLGSTSAAFVKANAEAKNVKLFPNNDAMFMELVSGNADAVIFDSPVVSDYLRKAGQGKVKIVGPVYQGQSYGIGFPKGSELVGKVNEALKSLKEKGVYKELHVKWFGMEPK